MKNIFKHKPAVHGGWIVYSVDCFGNQSVRKLFNTEQECIEFISRMGV